MNFKHSSSRHSCILVGTKSEISWAEVVLSDLGLDIQCTSPEELIAKAEHIHPQSHVALSLLVLTRSEDIDRHIKLARASLPTSTIFAIIVQEDSQTVVRLMEAGANDVLMLPRQAIELPSRLSAWKKRSASGENTEEVGPYSYDHLSKNLYHEGRRIPLTKKEQSIFSLLMDNRGSPTSRKAIHDMLYGFSDDMPFVKSLDVHIHNLRKKLRVTYEDKSLIETVAGQGYQIPK